MRRTSSGELFNMDSLTAAHKTLPFGTMVKVSRVDTGEFVWVKINDRLPKSSRRIIDLSRRAASDLNFIHDGLAQVRIEVENLAVLNDLIEYYSDGKENVLRLRPVEFAIEFDKKELETDLDTFGGW